MSDLDTLVKQYKFNALSRRGFMKAAGALGVAAPVASSILTVAGPVHAAAPKRGGVLRIAEGNTADTLEPVRMISATDAIYANQLYSRLTRQKADLTVEGDLAESWDVDPTAKVWTFKLRKAKFHNGQDVTADDVVASFSKHIAEGSESAAKAVLASVSSIEAVDKLTLKITLESGNADMPITMSDYHLCVHPADQKDFAKGAIGSGPFKIVEFLPGEVVYFERFDEYFLDGMPYLDGIEFIPVPDSTANLNAILSGDVDMIRDIPPTTFGKMSQAPGINVHNLPTGTFSNFAMMCDRAPTNDINFRKGFKHAMDRELILKQVFSGIGTIAADTPIGPTYPMYCEEVKPAEYDLDKAKHYFQKAGVTSLEIFTSQEAGAAANDIAYTYQQGAKGAIDVTVTKTPSDGYWSHTWMQQPIFMSGWNGRPTIDAFLTLAHMDGAGWNETTWGSPEYDAKIIAARAELNETLRQEMYCDMLKQLNEEGGLAIPVFQNQLEATGERVQGFEPHPVGAMGGFFNCSHKVWLDG
ncbi:ABC transporter substrate-binding protein [Curvivirga aplysinae]|uniref:ABC transporter substrate-binding protein n=1 Tax=Curvivirga aplysinae TaxID=2529852 RepID=UPI001C3F9B02|nr:ABC transporter substrate-binding protein [Curvivirga aplysinae]